MSADGSTQRDRQARRTKSRIRTKALELFAQRGYEGTSVRAIAEAAGVSEGLVFHHFGSKKDLLRDSVGSRATFADAIDETLRRAEGEPVEEGLRAIGRAFVEMLRTDDSEWHLAATIIGESQTNSELHEVFRRTIDTSVERMAKDFDRRIEAGELRADLDTEMAARSILGSLMLFLMTRSHLGGDAWVEAATEHVEGLVEHWVRTAKR